METPPKSTKNAFLATFLLDTSTDIPEAQKSN